MSDYEFDLPLPKQQRMLLLDLVQWAKKHEVMSVQFFSNTPDGLYDLDFSFSKTESVKRQLSENPVPGFEVLGFVKHDKEKNVIFLTPKAFKWADYEKKNRFRKFLAKHPFKDYMIALSVLLSLGLTILQILGLTLLQIVEVFQKLINPSALSL